MLPYDSLSFRLLRFYSRYGPDLPWRWIEDPYRIWLSEIMLHQTQVNTVAQRYLHLFQHFTSVG